MVPPENAAVAAAAPGLAGAAYIKILGYMCAKPQWEAVCRRNGWVDITVPATTS